MDWLLEYANTLPKEETVGIGIMMAVVGGFGLIWALASILRHLRGERTTMSTPEQKAREDWVKHRMADRIYDAIFESAFLGEITAEEEKQWCRMIGIRLNMPDLLPKGMEPGELREAIKTRLKSKTLYKALPILPGEKAKTGGIEDILGSAVTV